MCLGVPGEVLDVWVDESSQLPMGKVDFGGISRTICLAFTPEVSVGQFVLVHVGFAISHIDEEEAAKTLQLLQEMGELEELAHESDLQG